MRAVSMGNLAVVLAALASLSQPGHAQQRLTKSPAAVSGPATFTNPRGSVSVNLTISH
jgi:hypothetical protein